MERKYAVSLALVGMITVLVHGTITGGGSDEVLWTAWYVLLGFAFVGYLAGAMGARIVDEAVRGRFAQRMDETAQASGKKT